MCVESVFRMKVSRFKCLSSPLPAPCPLAAGTSCVSNEMKEEGKLLRREKQTNNIIRIGCKEKWGVFYSLESSFHCTSNLLTVRLWAAPLWDPTGDWWHNTGLRLGLYIWNSDLYWEVHLTATLFPKGSIYLKYWKFFFKYWSCTLLTWNQIIQLVDWFLNLKLHLLRRWLILSTVIMISCHKVHGWLQIGRASCRERV